MPSPLTGTKASAENYTRASSQYFFMLPRGLSPSQALKRDHASVSVGGGGSD